MKSIFPNICILIAAELLQACGSLLSDSKNVVILEAPNNNKTQKLTLFIKEGGATVGNSYQISALPVNVSIKDADVGNVFIADDHDGPISEDTSRVKFKWVSEDTAVIIFDNNLRVFKQKTKISGMTVLYDTTPQRSTAAYNLKDGPAIFR